MIRIVDQADLEIDPAVLGEILEIAEIPEEAVHPRFQLRPGRAALGILADWAAIPRFLAAAATVLDYDHVIDLFGDMHYVVTRSGTFLVFPDVLLEGGVAEFERPVREA